jgi:hypothetical protein
MAANHRKGDEKSIAKELARQTRRVLITQWRSQKKYDHAAMNRKFAENYLNLKGPA